MSWLSGPVELLKNCLVQSIHAIPFDVIILMHEFDTAGDALNDSFFILGVSC